MVVGSARPMEDAARIAYAALIKWMMLLRWDRWEAYQALTQIGDSYVGKHGRHALLDGRQDRQGVRDDRRLNPIATRRHAGRASNLARN